MKIQIYEAAYWCFSEVMRWASFSSSYIIILHNYWQLVSGFYKGRLIYPLYSHFIIICNSNTDPQQWLATSSNISNHEILCFISKLHKVSRVVIVASSFTCYQLPSFICSHELYQLKDCPNFAKHQIIPLRINVQKFILLHANNFLSINENAKSGSTCPPAINIPQFWLSYWMGYSTGAYNHSCMFCPLPGQ